MHPRERLCIEPFPCEVGELLGEEEQFALEVALKGQGAGRVALVAAAFEIGRNVLLAPEHTLGRVKEVQLHRPHRKTPPGGGESGSVQSRTQRTEKPFRVRSLRRKTYGFPEARSRPKASRNLHRPSARAHIPRPQPQPTFYS
jgi:hypothetical protein